MLDRFYSPLALALLAFAGTLATSSWQAMHARGADSPPERSVRVFALRSGRGDARRFTSNSSHDAELSRAPTARPAFASLPDATPSETNLPVDLDGRNNDT